MNYIKIDKVRQIVAKAVKQNFEVNPLDVNLAKIQFNLTKRLELEIPPHGDFAQVVESYISKDPTLKISAIEVICKKSNIDSPKQKLRTLQLKVTDKTKNSYIYEIASGEKKDILEAINNTTFFETCKTLILDINNCLR